MANATDGAAPGARSLYGAATPAVVVQRGAHQLHTGGAPALETPAEAGDDFEHWSEAGQYAPHPQDQAPYPGLRVPGAPLLDEGPARPNATASGDIVLEPPLGPGPQQDPRGGYAPAGGAVGGGTPPRDSPPPGGAPFVPGQAWLPPWPPVDGSPWHTTQSHYGPADMPVLRENKLCLKDLPTDMEEYRRWRYATGAAFI